MIPHEPWLVALSVAIAIQGSFVGLSLARGIDSAEGFRRRLAIAGSAITLATGVWSSPEEVAATWQLDRRFEPSMASAERERLLARWRRAVYRSRAWATGAGAAKA